MRTLIGLVLAALVLGCGDEERFGSSATPSVFERDAFLNIAHRGGARLAPEHTLVAYQNGLDVGADVIELDLHGTADGAIVALHDDSVDRTTDGSGLVRQLTLAEIRQLDAGFRFTRDGGQTHPWRGMGLRIPTLAEALDLLGGTPLSIEIKQRAPSIVAAVMDEIEARGLVANIVFASFPPEPVEEIRARNRAALTAFSTREFVEFSFLGPDTIAAYMPPAGFIQPPAQAADTILIERAHLLGLKVHAWTVNSRAEMCRLMQLGVDGLFTDDPATLHEVKADPACRPEL